MMKMEKEKRIKEILCKNGFVKKNEDALVIIQDDKIHVIMEQMGLSVPILGNCTCYVKENKNTKMQMSIYRDFVNGKAESRISLQSLSDEFEMIGEPLVLKTVPTKYNRLTEIFAVLAQS